MGIHPKLTSSRAKQVKIFSKYLKGIESDPLSRGSATEVASVTSGSFPGQSARTIPIAGSQLHVLQEIGGPTA